MKMKTLKVGNQTLEYNLCSCLDAYIYDKTFGIFIKRQGTAQGDNAISLTHIQIFEELEKATAVEVFNGKDKREMILKIETENYKISVFVKQEDE